MADTPTSSPRIVPGAPPPVTKTQKKKRKGGKGKEESESSHLTIPDVTAAASVEKSPEEGDIKESVAAPQLVAQTSEGLLTPALDGKHSPVVEMLNKRLKTNGKKIVSSSCH